MKNLNIILWFLGSLIWLSNAWLWTHMDNTTMVCINTFVSGWYFMTGVIMLYSKESKCD